MNVKDHVNITSYFSTRSMYTTQLLPGDIGFAEKSLLRNVVAVIRTLEMKFRLRWIYGRQYTTRGRNLGKRVDPIAWEQGASLNNHDR